MTWGSLGGLDAPCETYNAWPSEPVWAIPWALRLDGFWWPEWMRGLS